MTTNIAQTLNNREQTHGAFTHNANTSQLLKLVVRQNQRWHQLPDTHRESIEMILHKVSRAINGDHKNADTFHDIAGYATLVERELVTMDSIEEEDNDVFTDGQDSRLGNGPQPD